MSSPDPAQRGRLELIRDNLIDRIAEAEREGWFGEVDGLNTSLAATEDKLHQMTNNSRPGSVLLGMPTVPNGSSDPISPPGGIAAR
jgi:hypothetical protein